MTKEKTSPADLKRTVGGDGQLQTGTEQKGSEEGQTLGMQTNQPSSRLGALGTADIQGAGSTITGYTQPV